MTIPILFEISFFLMVLFVIFDQILLKEGENSVLRSSQTHFEPPLNKI